MGKIICRLSETRLQNLISLYTSLDLLWVCKTLTCLSLTILVWRPKLPVNHVNVYCNGDIEHFSSWASYQIRKIAGCACAGNARNVFPRRRFQRKPLVSDPGMHHGTCVTHVPWCMSGSLTCGDGENVPGIPGACAPAILRIWQEAHWGATQLYGLSNGPFYNMV